MGKGVSLSSVKRRWRLLIAAAAALLLASCQPCGGDLIVDLGTADGILYAVVEPFEGPPEAYASTDLGLTWAPTEDAPPSLEKPDCGADGACFRVVDEVTIERLNNVGEWQLLWRIPVEREDYVFSHACTVFGDGTGGHEMRFSTDPVTVDSADGTVVLVAMADQGVVRVTGNGVSRIAVSEWSDPTPFTGGFQGYYGELVIVLALSLLVLLFLTMLGAASRASGSLRAALIGTLVWIGLVLAPFELWARGVFDSYGTAMQAARVIGIAGAGIIALIQYDRTRPERPRSQPQT